VSVDRSGGTRAPTAVERDRDSAAAAPPPAAAAAAAAPPPKSPFLSQPPPRQKKQQTNSAVTAVRTPLLSSLRPRPLATSIAAKGKGGGKSSKGGKGGKGGGGSDDDDDDDDAPAKGGGKKAGGKGGAKDAASSSSGSSDDLDKLAVATKKDADERMAKALAAMQSGFETMRTGRANPALLDRVVVDYFGAPTPIKSIASVAVADATTLVVTPFDKAAFKDVEKALMTSSGDFGATPNSDGERLRINLPPMTQDRRKELAKAAAKAGEDAKVAVRNVRKDALKKLDKGDFGKDARKQLDDEVQKITDGYVKKVDDAVKAKSDELLKL
jgi:ribosome recycling factor